MVDWLLYILAFFIGALIGTAATRHLFLKQHNRDLIGELRIDRSDPDGPPLCFMEVYKGVGDFSKMKYVMLEVKNENYISQE